MAEKSLLQKKFLLEKKSIKMEDCIMYIEQFHPEDKEWFFKLSTEEVELSNGKTGLRNWLTIKSAFYDRYFKASKELSRRMKLFADWDIQTETKAD